MRMGGISGLIVAIVALFGAGLAGLALSADTVTEDVTIYSPVTDLGGLFSYSEEPEYIEYNPASNWTGFTEEINGTITGGITYTPSRLPNSYPIKQTSVTDSTTTITLDKTVLTQSYPPGYDAATDFISVQTTDYNEFIKNIILWPNMTTIKNLYDSTTLNAYKGYDLYRFDLTDGGPVLISMDAWEIREQDIFTTYTTDYIDADYLIYNRNANVVEAYNSSNQVIKLLSEDVAALAYGGRQQSTIVESQTTTLVVQMQYYNAQDPVFIDTAAGVTVPDQAWWSNGEANSRIDILVRGNGTMDIRMNLLDDVGQPSNDDWLWIRYQSTYTGKNITWGESYLNTIGFWEDTQDGTMSLATAWSSYLISVNLTTGKMDVVPVYFTTFRNFAPSDAGGVTIDLPVSGSTTRLMQFKDDSRVFDLNFGIVGTAVWLDSYGVVMHNPSINVSNYFDYPIYRVEFSGFTVTGNYVTVNSQQFYVEDGNIVIDGRTVRLKNLTVEVGETTVIRAGDVSADLGATTSQKIQFRGNWYFTAQLYEGEESTQDRVEWTPDIYTFTTNQTIAVYLGMLVLGVIVASRLQTLGFADYAVVAVAASLAWVTMVI